MPAIGIIANFSSIKKLRMEQFRIVVTEFGKCMHKYFSPGIIVSGQTGRCLKGVFMLILFECGFII